MNEWVLFGLFSNYVVPVCWLFVVFGYQQVCIHEKEVYTRSESSRSRYALRAGCFQGR